jgi:urea transport system substrate-binding protein
VGEEELRNIRPLYVQGHYAAWSYFQSIETERNQDFVSRFQREYGYDRVIGDPMEAAYTSVYLWKQAVEKAGNFATTDVRKAIQSGIPFEAPGGTIQIDPKTQHTFMHFRLGRIRKNRQFEIVHQSNEPIAPEPYPQFVFPGWHCDWTADGLTRGPEVLIGS